MTAPEEPLQFDAAEPVAGGVGVLACANCGAVITGSYHMLNQAVICATCRGVLEAHLVSTSHAAPLLRALVYGLGAAVVGAGLYYAVLALTGLEIGLIAIVVGFLVGKAVATGSGGHGGWRYQALAVALTYLAIVSTYVPFILRAIAANGVATPHPLLVARIAIQAPFLGGLDNILGLLIIGFALFQAWRMNQRAALVFSGPFQVGAAAAG